MMSLYACEGPVLSSPDVYRAVRSMCVAMEEVDFLSNNGSSNAVFFPNMNPIKVSCLFASAASTMTMTTD